MWKRVVFLLAAGAIGAMTFGQTASAEPSVPVTAVRSGVYVPEALRPWAAWVLYDKEDALCPFLHGKDEGLCTWPGSLAVALNDRGGSFTQQWRVYKREAAPLPGDSKTWPQNLRVDGKPAVAIGSEDDDDGAPMVWLTPGEHTVTGNFFWDEMPESLAVPPATGLLTLAVRGKAVPFPHRGEDGELWLQKLASSSVEEDMLDITVHRMVQDEVPLKLTTRIELRVAGKNREVILGRALGKEFTPMALESQLPARIETDSRLRVQVRPGDWTITLVARHDGPVVSLSRPAPEGPWASSEVWAFDARADLRTVTIEGVSAIDPQQTTIPDEWKKLPCYPMNSTSKLALAERRRGDANPAPDELGLHRELWLDFDGQGYTVSDQISGKLSRSWRLEVLPPTELGRISVGGKDQFITRSAAADGGRPGVEIRQSSVDVSTDSRMPRRGSMSAVSWNADFQKVSGLLHLPAGWRLFRAGGVDEAPGTWLGSWSLLDFFLVLIISLATMKLFGLVWGIIALATLTLIFPENEAPQWIWLVVLGAEAVLRVLSKGRLFTMLRLVRGAALIALIVMSFSFAAQQIRFGLHPGLEQADAQSAGEQPMRFAKMMALEAPPPPPPAQPSAMPSAKPAPREATLQREDEESDALLKEKKVTVKGDRAAAAKSLGGAPKQEQPQQAFAQNAFDPNAMVQTGPGKPNWSWREFSLSWNGPVERTQMLSLWLIPPWANLFLAFLRVLLLALLIVRMMGRPDALLSWLRSRRRGAMPTGAALLAFIALAGSARLAYAEFPPEPLLNTLRERLLEKPKCSPSCASIARLELEVTPSLLRARLEVGAAASTAVPLPGNATQWSPQRVLLDGRPAQALARADGELWLQVSEGNHQVLLEGQLPDRDTVQIALPLKPHRVEARTQGWRLDGIHEDGIADDNLQLSRVRGAREAAADSLQAGTLPPFVRIEREVSIGLLWEVNTKVVRLTPTGSAVVIEVPLLPGESITTANVRVKGGKALINMDPSATETSWHSLLQERSPVMLAAPTTLSWTELWRLDVSPIWHVSLGGIPVIHQQNDSGLRRPEWQPWPGEKVTIEVTRPEGIAGRTLTIDESELTLKPGLRATDAELTLSLRSSRGGEHLLTLPEGATLQSLTINDATQPIRQDKRQVTLQITPGATKVHLVWRQPTGIGMFFRSPEVNLGAASVNAQVNIDLASNRWVLFVGGPYLGPVVLFWSLLIVLLIAALLLGQFSFVPLKARHWLLLGLGLTQVPLEAAALVPLWLLLLGWRKNHPLPSEWRRTFNLLQIGIVLVTLAALGVLVAAIERGLLGTPEMQIAGNGSGANALHWFQDRTSATPGRAWVFSVPLWCYRVAMLAWALWMARTLIAWLRWGWGAVSGDELWRKKPPRLPEKPSEPKAAAT